MEDHQRCMVENAGPPCGIEPSILEMITRPNMERERESVVFSPSSLSSCHRQTALKTNNDWYLAVDQGYKMVRGTIVHNGMGHEPPYPGVLGVVRELRMGAPINTKYGMQQFKGKPDLVVLLGVTVKPEVHPDEVVDLQLKNQLHIKIVDYKTRSEVGHDLVRADDKYAYQVNMYAWLAAQFLPHYINNFASWDGAGDDYADHLFLNNPSLPYIDEVVIDELSITYMDMKQTRTFTSKGLLSAKGKMLGDRVNGRWIRRTPAEHDELELEPIPLFRPKYTESLIRQGIEKQIDAETMLAPPLEGADAELMCRNCPVREACYLLGRREGYKMTDQAPFISIGSVKR
jgi:hypothetical protein